MAEGAAIGSANVPVGRVGRLGGIVVSGMASYVAVVAAALVVTISDDLVLSYENRLTAAWWELMDSPLSQARRASQPG